MGFTVEYVSGPSNILGLSVLHMQRYYVFVLILALIKMVALLKAVSLSGSISVNPIEKLAVYRICSKTSQGKTQSTRAGHILYVFYVRGGGLPVILACR